MHIQTPFPGRVRPLAAAGLVTATAAIAAGCGANTGEDNLVAGKQLFVQKCSSCHILGRAEAKGVVGPNLDEAFKRSLADGFDRDGIRGVVYRQIKDPRAGSSMPADLVDDEGARDVAAYVALVTGKPGKDEGLLATAVKSTTSDEPAVAENGVLTIPADPGGQLLFVNATAEAPAGPLRVVMPNESGIAHNIVFPDIPGAEGEVVTAGESVVEFDATPGEYRYVCTVPGHTEAGMVGTLTVK